jgi:hypothetical protein
MILPENKNVLSLASHKWLREAGEYAPPHYLHLITLATWGLENGVEGGGLIVTASSLANVYRKMTVELAARHKLPAVYSARYFVTGGG